MIELFYTKISPSQNMTALVEVPLERGFYPRAAALIMEDDPDIEQVGFLEKAPDPADFHLQMAGGEFCGNAAVSAAALLAKRRGLEIVKTAPVTASVSGCDTLLGAEVFRGGERRFRVKLQMPLPHRIETRQFYFDGQDHTLPVVSFPGISHVIVRCDMQKLTAEAAVKKWCLELGADALGLMLLSGSDLTPLVYVKNPETLVWERSCASGTAACGALLSLLGDGTEFSFRQPGGTLKVSSTVRGGSIGELFLQVGAEILCEKMICLE